MMIEFKKVLTLGTITYFYFIVAIIYVSTC